MDRIIDSRNHLTKRRLLAASGTLALALSVGACGGSDDPEKSCENQTVTATKSLNTLGEMASVALTREVIARSPDAADIDSVGIMQFDQNVIDNKAVAIRLANGMNDSGSDIYLGEEYKLPVCTPETE